MTKAIFTYTFLILTIYVSCKAKADCNIFTCTNSNTMGQCFSAKKNSEGNSYSLSYSVCALGYNCISAFQFIPGFSPNTNNCIAESSISSPTNIYPGENCSSNSDCKSNNCLNGKCKGLVLNASCKANIDCDVGLYCNLISKACANQLGLGEKCFTENDCLNTATCNNSKCINYYTIDNGTQVTNPNACSSGMYYQDPSSFTITCDVKTLDSSECGDNQDSCTYKYLTSNKIENGSCDCNLFVADQSRTCSQPSSLKVIHNTGVHTDLRIQAAVIQGLITAAPICYGESILGIEGRKNWLLKFDPTKTNNNPIFTTKEANSLLFNFKILILVVTLGFLL